MNAVLRRLPVPVTEPFPCTSLPANEEVPATQGTLALAFTTEVADPRSDEDTWASPQATATSRLPDPAQACVAVVQAVVEVLAGTRPATQLVRWLSADVYTALQRRAALAARLRRHRGHGGGAPPQARRPVVRGVRVCAPADGVAEASAVVLDRGRVRAVAVRLEGLDGRWRATALEIG